MIKSLPHSFASHLKRRLSLIFLIMMSIIAFCLLLSNPVQAQSCKVQTGLETNLGDK